MTATRAPSRAPTRPTGRPRAVRRRPRRWALLALGGVLVLAVALWAVLAGPLLPVRSVTVSGAPSAVVESIVTAAGVRDGTPLLSVDAASVADRVAAAVPAVGAVDVRRSLSGTVSIAVTMRSPVSVVKKSDGSLTLVSSDGVAYARVAKAPAGLLVVTAGAHPPTAAGYRAAAAVREAFPAAQRAKLTAVGVDGDSVSFVLDGVHVVWGDGSATATKARLVTILLGSRPRPSVIDVSTPSTPVTR